jgi:hypothetical protein
MKSKAYVPKETSIYMRYLFQDKGLRGNELLKRFPKYSKATIYRHAKLPINEVATFDKRKHNKGRPKKKFFPYMYSLYWQCLLPSITVLDT